MDEDLFKNIDAELNEIDEINKETFEVSNELTLAINGLERDLEKAFKSYSTERNTKNIDDIKIMIENALKTYVIPPSSNVKPSNDNEILNHEILNHMKRIEEKIEKFVSTSNTSIEELLLSNNAYLFELYLKSRQKPNTRRVKCSKSKPIKKKTSRKKK